MCSCVTAMPGGRRADWSDGTHISDDRGQLTASVGYQFANGFGFLANPHTQQNSGYQSMHNSYGGVDSYGSVGFGTGLHHGHHGGGNHIF